VRLVRQVGKCSVDVAALCQAGEWVLENGLPDKLCGHGGEGCRKHRPPLREGLVCHHLLPEGLLALARADCPVQASLQHARAMLGDVSAFAKCGLYMQRTCTKAQQKAWYSQVKLK